MSHDGKSFLIKPVDLHERKIKINGDYTTLKRFKVLILSIEFIIISLSL